MVRRLMAVRAVLVLALAGMALVFTGGALAGSSGTSVLQGPVWPAPEGGTWTPSGGDPGSGAGTLGTYDGFASSAYRDLYWGSYAGADPGVGFDGQLHSLTYSAAASDLENGVIRFTGSTPPPPNTPGTPASYDTRLTLRITDADGTPLSLVDAASIGAPEEIGAVTHVTGDYRVRFLFEAKAPASATWMPAKDFYDAIPKKPADAPEGSYRSTVSGGFYYTYPAPSIAIDTPEYGAIYAQDSEHAIAYSCTDRSRTSIVSCEGDAPVGSALDTAELGDHTFTVNAEDELGDTSSKTVTYTIEDRTPPTIDISSPQDGQTYAQGSALQANYTCADNDRGSGIASCEGDAEDGADLDTTTVGTHTFTVTATDEAGNESTRTVTYTIADQTPPTITFTSPADGATYPFNSDVRASYSCADTPGGSGIVSCTGTKPNGTKLDTSLLALGKHTFSVTAVDNAGNRTTVTHTYYVGLALPISLLP